MGLIERLKPRPEAVVLEVRAKVEKQFQHISKRGMRIQNPSAYLRKLLMNQSLFEQTAQRTSDKKEQADAQNGLAIRKQAFEQALAEKTEKLRETYLTPELQEQILERLQKNPLLVRLLKDEKHIQVQIDRYLQKTYLTPAEYTFTDRK